MTSTEQKVGNAQECKSLTLVINTNFKCKKYYLASSSPLLHTLDAQWTSTSLKLVGRKNANIYNTKGGLVQGMRKLLCAPAPHPMRRRSMGAFRNNVDILQSTFNENLRVQEPTK